MRSVTGESVKILDCTFFLCLLSHLGPRFGYGSTSFGEILFLLVPEISRAAGVLAEGTDIFSVRLTDDDSKSH